MNSTNGIPVGGATVVAFTDFANLTGGSQADLFTLDATGGWTGILNGGAGIDTLSAFPDPLNEWTSTMLNGQRFAGIEVKLN